MNKLSAYSDLVLLAELLKRNHESPCPKKVQRQGDWHSYLIAIGNDEIAEIVLTDEARKELEMMEGV